MTDSETGNMENITYFSPLVKKTREFLILKYKLLAFFIVSNDFKTSLFPLTLPQNVITVVTLLRYA